MSKVTVSTGLGCREKYSCFKHVEFLLSIGHPSGDFKYMYGRARWTALLVCLREDLETSVRERPLLGVGPVEGVRP